MILHLDGDKYRLRLPYTQTLLDCAKFPDFLCNDEEIFAALVPNEDECGHGIKMEEGEFKHLQNVKFRKGSNRTELDKLAFNIQRQFSYRPMLIPVLKNGHFDNSLTDIPNGCLTTCFSLHINNQYITRPDVAFPYTAGPVKFADSTGDRIKDLKWIVWNGMLVCDRTLLVGIRYGGLVGHGLVKGLKWS